jgi:dTDP-4-amino-4,6-dideoxygalactose transaminase
LSSITSVPLLDTTRISDACSKDLQATCERIIKSGQFILGPEVTNFEETMAQFLGAKHAIGVSSGTDALILALMTLGVGQGDEVICPSFTFFATAGAIWRVGAKPVFVDIDPASFNMDPSLLEAAITENTRAIMPVHLFGQMADMHEINAIAHKHGLPVIEDAAQAIGSSIDGCNAGTMGSIGAFSFFPTKNLGGYGDAGLVVTSDDAIAEKARVLRVHGAEKRYYHQTVGGNFRIDALQAGLIGTRFKHLGTGVDGRRAWAGAYDAELKKQGLCDPGPSQLTLPPRTTGRHAFNQYTLRAASNAHRQHILSELSAANVGHSVYYPVPLHRQECFASLGYHDGQLPHTEAASETVFSIPVFPQLSKAEHGRVVEVLVTASQSFAG